MTDHQTIADLYDLILLETNKFEVEPYPSNGEFFIQISNGERPLPRLEFITKSSGTDKRIFNKLKYIFTILESVDTSLSSRVVHQTHQERAREFLASLKELSDLTDAATGSIKA